MHEKGQGAFEYVLMLGGVLLVVIVVSLLLNIISHGTASDAEKSACVNALVRQSNNSGVPYTRQSCYLKDLVTGKVSWDVNGYVAYHIQGTDKVDYVPAQCRTLGASAQGIPLGLLPVGGDFPQNNALCNAAPDNFRYLYHNSIGTGPDSALAWCCGPQPFPS